MTVADQSTKHLDYLALVFAVVEEARSCGDYEKVADKKLWDSYGPSVEGLKSDCPELFEQEIAPRIQKIQAEKAAGQRQIAKTRLLEAGLNSLRAELRSERENGSLEETIRSELDGLRQLLSSAGLKGEVVQDLLRSQLVAIQMIKLIRQAVADQGARMDQLLKKDQAERRAFRALTNNHVIDLNAQLQFYETGVFARNLGDATDLLDRLRNDLKHIALVEPEKAADLQKKLTHLEAQIEATKEAMKAPERPVEEPQPEPIAIPGNARRKKVDPDQTSYDDGERPKRRTRPQATDGSLPSDCLETLAQLRAELAKEENPEQAEES